MAPRRKVIPVTLTHQQRERLERLWFIYGNHGPKMTRGNHSFIQGLLERGQDERPLKQRGWMPTEECERAVDRILSSERDQEGEEDSHIERLRRFKLISTTAVPDPSNRSPEKDSELNDLIKSLQRRNDRSEVKKGVDDEIPPAA